MPLNSDYPDLVDVLLVDDRGSGPRGTRANAESLLSAAVPCRVLDVTATALRPGVGLRESTEHRFHVLFPTATRLNRSHRLRWADPVDGSVLVLEVTGTVRRQARSLPDVVLASWYESGATP